MGKESANVYVGKFDESAQIVKINLLQIKLKQ